MNRPYVAALAVIVILAMIRSSRAQDVIDQSNVAVWNAYPDVAGALIISNISQGQVVTAGQSGRLSKVDLDVGRTNVTVLPLHVDIVQVDGLQVPEFGDLGRIATRTIDAASVPLRNATAGTAFGLSVDFSAENVEILAGQSFAIVLRTFDGTGGYSWSINVNNIDSYSGGSFYRHGPDFEDVFNAMTDAQFRTIVTIPETRSDFLAGLAFAMSGVVLPLRRRRK